MRKSTAYFFVLAAIFVAANCLAAEVTNVELTYQDGYTVVRIDVNGTIRFTHQTEIAKDGKPFRVIVDVLSATHELGAKSFLSLPKCAVMHIRTSQYSVKPEKIVRLVFDMATESIYQIDSDTRVIRLSFPDKNSKAFASWSTRKVVSAQTTRKSQDKVLVSASNRVASSATESAKNAAKITARLNSSIEADRQASLASTGAPSAPKKQVAASQENAQIATKSASAKKDAGKEIARPSVSEETLARASGSKAPYPPDHQAAKFEPKKAAQTDGYPVQKSSKAEQGAAIVKVTPTNEVHAGFAEASTKATSKQQPSTSKSSPKVSQRVSPSAPAKTSTKPDTQPKQIGMDHAKKRIGSKKESKPVAGPSLAANSSPEKAKKSEVKKVKADKYASSKKVSAEQPGSSNKLSPAGTSTSGGSPAIDTKTGALTPKAGATKSDSTKPKDEVSGKKSKAGKPSPAKPESKKKKKPVYASTGKTKSSGAIKKASGKATESTTEKKAARKEHNKVTSKKSSGSSKKQLAQKKNDGKRATSRFRRSRGQTKKIKGTMVAEFPKRLVIKYKGRSRRDPFATLVNERKTNNSLVERRAPNVEGLKLVGVIEATDADSRALFEDTDGFGYILKSGDKVKNGYVLRVESERVYFQIFEYGWSRTVALNLEAY